MRNDNQPERRPNQYAYYARDRLSQSLVQRRQSAYGNRQRRRRWTPYAVKQANKAARPSRDDRAAAGRNAATISGVVGATATAIAAAIDQRRCRDEKTTGTTTAMIAVRRKKSKKRCARSHTHTSKEVKAALIAALMAPRSTPQRLSKTSDDGRGNSRGSVARGKQCQMQTKECKKCKRCKKSCRYVLT